ncbi:unnamed protein product [Trichogramma brassicae]|uniref:Uncharacterized protein n=1 Tax=Trichogramma brassicae TaxID=86971 RepID=A0A6H5IRW0_9HYME|nr:unnamed protein product [Trichogramma brassicae]
MLLYHLVLVTCLSLVSSELSKLDTVYEWNYIDFAWDSPAEREKAVKNESYDFTRILPVDVDVYRDGRVFVTMIGMHGVPATLGTVTDVKGPSGPLIKPYPDWSWFKENDCDSIRNVHRIAIDKCDRLWVLDTGSREVDKSNCPAQLLTFDLRTDKLIQRLKIPNHIARNKQGDTLLVTPIVETNGEKCEDTIVYMADQLGEGLVIWNGVRIYRLDSPIFQHEPSAQRITVGNHSIDYSGGIAAMAISPRLFHDEPRLLYFHALASYTIYATNSQILKRSTFGDTIRFTGAENILSSQAVAQAFSSNGTLFVGMTREMSICCWNRYRSPKLKNIITIAQDNETLQYTSGLKVIQPSERNPEEELWLLTNKFVEFQLGKLDVDRVNFRVLKRSVRELVDGTRCDLPPGTRMALEQHNSLIESRLIVTN